MKISIYADTADKEDMRRMADISKVLSGKKMTKNDLEKIIQDIISGKSK